MRDFHLTVVKLKEFIEKNNLPDDALIYVQRVEDVYFKEHGWGVRLKDNEYSLDKEIPENLREEIKDQYFLQLQAIKYPDDNNLYITAHY